MYGLTGYRNRVFKKTLGFKNHILLRWSARTKRLRVSIFYSTITILWILSGSLVVYATTISTTFCKLGRAMNGADRDCDCFRKTMVEDFYEEVLKTIALAIRSLDRLTQPTKTRVKYNRRGKMPRLQRTWYYLRTSHLKIFQDNRLTCVDWSKI